VCGLTQVLVFIESVIREKKRGGVYVNWWWYQSWTIFLYYACWSFLIGESISIWMSPFRFKSSCARDGGMWWIILHRGDHIWSSGWVFFLPWVILRREGRHDHIWISFFCDVSSGVDYAPIWEMGGVYPYMGAPQRHRSLGCLKLITLYYSCLFLLRS
jgi:hypothetical protein